MSLANRISARKNTRREIGGPAQLQLQLQQAESRGPSPAATAQQQQLQLQEQGAGAGAGAGEGEGDEGRRASLQQLGAGFAFFNTLQSHPAVGLYVYLLPKSTIPNAQHDSGDIF
jgi:hypothetical protein